MTDTITIRRPDDWHVHLRDGAMLAGVDYVLMGAGIPKEIPGALKGRG